MARIAYSSEVERLLVKQANLYRLHELVDSIIMDAASGVRFSFTETIIRRLHTVAMRDLLTTAGRYRNGPVMIRNSPHQPPHWPHVPRHIAELIKYIEENWDKRDLVHLSAFVLWRLNWIHPFENGNGRTARAAAYLVLSAKHGNHLPAKNTIVQQIIANRQPYYQQLRQCDAKFTAGAGPASVADLESFLGYLLKEQLKASLP